MKTYRIKGRDFLGEWMEMTIKANSKAEASNEFYRKHNGIAFVIDEIAE